MTDILNEQNKREMYGYKQRALGIAEEEKKEKEDRIKAMSFKMQHKKLDKMTGDFLRRREENLYSDKEIERLEKGDEMLKKNKKVVGNSGRLTKFGREWKYGTETEIQKNIDTVEDEIERRKLGKKVRSSRAARVLTGYGRRRGRSKRRRTKKRKRRKRNLKKRTRRRRRRSKRRRRR
tara:strand:- start:1653 stop:2186 length:534 start_codon:yes stop_codon:yes gene_type:complete